MFRYEYWRRRRLNPALAPHIDVPLVLRDGSCHFTPTVGEVFDQSICVSLQWRNQWVVRVLRSRPAPSLGSVGEFAGDVAVGPLVVPMSVLATSSQMWPMCLAVFKAGM